MRTLLTHRAFVLLVAAIACAGCTPPKPDLIGTWVEDAAAAQRLQLVPVDGDGYISFQRDPYSSQRKLAFSFGMARAFNPTDKYSLTLREDGIAIYEKSGRSPLLGLWNLSRDNVRVRIRFESSQLFWIARDERLYLIGPEDIDTALYRGVNASNAWTLIKSPATLTFLVPRPEMVRAQQKPVSTRPHAP